MIDLEHEIAANVDVVRFRGRLGAADSAEVATQVVNIFEQGGGELHLEMSGLEWIDSSGLSALVNIYKRVRKQEGSMVLFNVNDRVRALLEMTRLHEIFDIQDDMDLAEPRKASGF